MTTKNIYQPFKIKIDKIEKHSRDVKLFRLVGDFSKNKDGTVFMPGQFVLASHFGYGEAPFGIASSPYQDSYIDLIIRKTGILTSALHQLKAGDEIFMRGPYGNGFPVDFISGKDLVMVTGGCGIPPIAALIEYINAHRDRFGRVYLIYGARTPADLLIKDKLKQWEDKIKVLLTVDKPAKDWSGYVGMVSELVDEIKIDSLDAVAAMCGPGPMIDALEKILRPLGISDRRIFVSMERKMQCGIGKCQHCVVGDKYVCQDGPVFYYDQIDKSWG
ncbi:MAG: hydrogenase [Parcubacteria group bacterium]|jgi:NAD(P)H-flavin reductase|nr:hydrogenase [Parcubacteria group bacterium]|tara:strand:+ start:4362 stop:5183 length:822 start_codon:yes stop_codon:yes gene_type:complete